MRSFSEHVECKVTLQHRSYSGLLTSTVQSADNPLPSIWHIVHKKLQTTDFVSNESLRSSYTRAVVGCLVSSLITMH